MAEYPDFQERTGYGITGAGLCGWNCRHSFWPFVEGVSERAYTDAELDAMKGENNRFTYQGREYDGYTASQRQRQIERTIRKLKRELAAYKASGLTDDASLVSSRLRRLQSEYRKFSKAAGLPEQRERMRV